MRRIIFVNRYYFPDHSATAQLLTDLASAMARRGFAVHVITSRQIYDDANCCLPNVDNVDGVSVERVVTTRFGRQRLIGRAFDYLSFYMAATLCLWRNVGEDDVIVAKTDPPLLSILTAAIAHFRKAECVNWLQDLFPEVAVRLGVAPRQRVLWHWITKWRDRSLRAARSNVVIGARMAARLRAQGIPAERINVIHNWADGQLVRPVQPADNALRSSWGLADKFVVGYSGNLGRAHEFATILSAAERLIDYPDIVFLFIGNGAQHAAVAARKLSNVMLRPYQPRARLAESLSVPDLHLISLRPNLEGLIVPSKFYGIAAAGRPSLFIGDPKGEIGQLVTDEHLGFAVQEGDVASLVETIMRAASDKAMVCAMGARARAYFLAHFDKSIALARWEQLLRGVLAGELEPVKACVTRA